MIQNSLFLLSIALISALSFQVEAAPSCSAIYGKSAGKEKEYVAWTGTPSLQEYQGELDPKKLKKAGFVLSEDGKLSTLATAQQEAREIGQIKIFKTPVLFQWADQEYNQDLIGFGKIDKDWMNLILAEDGQAVGKGFYVSVDPIDSCPFGTHLNTFKTKGAVIVLEYQPLWFGEFYRNTEFVKRLADAGIDGIRKVGYLPTWLSIISNRHLVMDSERLFGILDYIKNTVAAGWSPQGSYALEHVSAQVSEMKPQKNPKK